MVLDREFPPDLRVENEIGTLAKAGYKIHLACYTRKNRPAFEKSGHLYIHRKSISPFIYKSGIAVLTLPFYKNFWMKFLRSILNQQHFDAIHIHDLPLVGIGTFLKKEFSLYLIADLHENWPAFVKISKHTRTLAGRLLSPVLLWRSHEKKVLPQADAIIVVVDEAKDRLIRLGIPLQLITVVSNTINLTEFGLPADKSEHKEILLFYAGGINRHRGLQNVIHAIHRMKDPGLRFWILGEGSYQHKLNQLVAKLSLQKNILFKGFHPFQKMMEMLQEADFAIIPHLKNEHTDFTIPHKLFQYMYLKKPVIASDCNPVKRILETTGSGIIYPSDNIGRLTKILDQIETINREAMGGNGNNAVIEKYNWNQDGTILLNLYMKIIPLKTINP